MRSIVPRAEGISRAEPLVGWMLRFAEVWQEFPHQYAGAREPHKPYIRRKFRGPGRAADNSEKTERCNHYCLMCSQPPRNVDDSWILQEIRNALSLIDKQTRSLGFTGGEPLLDWQEFIAVLS